MPVDFLPRKAVNAISSDLSSYGQEHNKEDLLRHLQLYILKRVLPENKTMAQLVYKMSNDCFVQNGVVWKMIRGKSPTSLCFVGAPTFGQADSFQSTGTSTFRAVWHFKNKASTSTSTIVLLAQHGQGHL
jgi:hypothetical protein